MFEVSITELFIIEINVIRFALASFLIFTGCLGGESRLDKLPNTATLVFLTGILLMGLSIS